MALTNDKLVFNLLSGKYNKGNIHSMYVEATLTANQKRLDILNTYCDIGKVCKVKQEYRNMTREEMIAKGIIRPAPETITPKKEREAVLDTSSVQDEDKELTDITVAKKLVEKANNAKARGLEFNLSFSDMKKLLKKKYCHYSGEKLSDIVGDANQRTLDRVDDKKGYVKGNVVACSHKFNQIKARLFEDQNHDLHTTVKAMKKFLSKLE